MHSSGTVAALLVGPAAWSDAALLRCAEVCRSLGLDASPYMGEWSRRWAVKPLVVAGVQQTGRAAPAGNVQVAKGGA